LEARLRARLTGEREGERDDTKRDDTTVPSTDAVEAVAAVDDRRTESGAPMENDGQRPPLQGTESESINVWPDEAAEASFMAEARGRGEPITAAAVRSTGDVTEERGESKALPPLEELVKRLTPEVRETLDDLFRARFTAVRRVPKNALKS
jgi:hypothetical protein